MTSRSVVDTSRYFGDRGIEAPPWLIRRWYDTGTLPAPSRIGRYRLVPDDHLPLIETLLRRAGRMPADVPAGAVA